MKNSLNILTQQKQQEIDDKIKEKQNKEILQSLKKDIIIILDDKIKKYYNKYGAFYILNNEQDIIDEVLQKLNKLSNDYITHNVDCDYNILPELTKIDLINDLFYNEFKKIRQREKEIEKIKKEMEEQEELPKIDVPFHTKMHIISKLIDKMIK